MRSAQVAKPLVQEAAAPVAPCGHPPGPGARGSGRDRDAAGEARVARRRTQLASAGRSSRQKSCQSARRSPRSECGVGASGQERAEVARRHQSDRPARIDQRHRAGRRPAEHLDQGDLLPGVRTEPQDDLAAVAQIGGKLDAVLGHAPPRRPEAAVHGRIGRARPDRSAVAPREHAAGKARPSRHLRGAVASVDVEGLRGGGPGGAGRPHPHLSHRDPAGRLAAATIASARARNGGGSGAGRRASTSRCTPDCSRTAARAPPGATRHPVDQAQGGGAHVSHRAPHPNQVTGAEWGAEAQAELEGGEAAPRLPHVRGSHAEGGQGVRVGRREPVDVGGKPRAPGRVDLPRLERVPRRVDEGRDLRGPAQPPRDRPAGRRAAGCRPTRPGAPRRPGAPSRRAGPTGRRPSRAAA